ncbi:MAG: 2-amino-4-hydroxy-6-hydroxymethyldihydropteridine diphosphokinase [Paludibacteraceae bacterium]
MNTVYFSLGANLGNREQTLMEAIHRMEQRVGTLLRCSSFYYSEPWGFQSEHPFCNICASFQTDQSPDQVLAETQIIERELGRLTKTSVDTENGTPIYHDRTIDIDLLQYFDHQGKELVMHTRLLTLPHPHIQERDFVCIPFKEITLS